MDLGQRPLQQQPSLPGGEGVGMANLDWNLLPTELIVNQKVCKGDTGWLDQTRLWVQQLVELSWDSSEGNVQELKVHDLTLGC